ncbi:hypothetical protein, partial [Paenibacillus sp. ISL-20]|uniref:hypothetical protein n=1 Tax=Paenibacillus sp. ISL-20 TaxID=2819163 RepID=UPI001BECE738
MNWRKIKLTILAVSVFFLVLPGCMVRSDEVVMHSLKLVENYHYFLVNNDYEMSDISEMKVDESSNTIHFMLKNAITYDFSIEGSKGTLEIKSPPNPEYGQDMANLAAYFDSNNSLKKELYKTQL